MSNFARSRAALALFFVLVLSLGLAACGSDDDDGGTTGGGGTTTSAPTSGTASILFTTDAQLAAEKDKYVILEDDLGIFPAGQVVFVTDQKVAQQAGPDYQATIEAVQEGLTVEAIQELDARVDIDQEEPEAVAGQYLDEAGFAEGGDKAIESNAQNGSTTLTIGSKNFTEQIVLGEIYAQALELAGYKVEKDLNLGSEVIARQSVRSGEISGYPEYISTALTSFFGVQPQDVPADPQEGADQAKAEFEKEGLTSFAPTEFASANAVGMLRETAEAGGFEKVSDLQGKVDGYTLYGSPECRQRVDCLVGLEQNGIEFGTFKPVDIALRYDVLDRGQ